MKGVGQCYSEGFSFSFCFWVVCICNTKRLHVLYLLKNAEMKHQVVNAAPGCKCYGIPTVQLYFSGCCWVNIVMYNVKGSPHEVCPKADFS